jgi:hypothetical protein
MSFTEAELKIIAKAVGTDDYSMLQRAFPGPLRLAAAAEQADRLRAQILRDTATVQPGAVRALEGYVSEAFTDAEVHTIMDAAKDDILAERLTEAFTGERLAAAHRVIERLHTHQPVHFADGVQHRARRTRRLDRQSGRRPHHTPGTRMTQPVVDWPAVYRQLSVAVTFTGDVERAVQWRIAHRLPLLSAEHMRLACTVVTTNEHTIATLTALPAGTCRWLTRSAPIAYSAVTYRPAPIRWPATPSCRLHLDPRLGDPAAWPLHALADSWARKRARPLIVVGADLAPGSQGTTRLRETVHVESGGSVEAAVIRLGPHASHAQLHDTWRHELGHLLDVDPAKTEHHAEHEHPQMHATEPSNAEIVYARAQLLAEFAALPLVTHSEQGGGYPGGQSPFGREIA